MKEKLIKLFKKFNIAGYSKIRFTIYSGNDIKIDCIVTNNTTISEEAAKVPAVSKDFTLRITEYNQYRIPLNSTKVDIEHLKDLSKYMNDLKFDDVKYIIVTGWDNTKIVFYADCTITLKRRDSGLYEAVQVDDELVMYTEVIFRNPDFYTPRFHQMVMSYFPTTDLGVVTFDDDHIAIFGNPNKHIDKHDDVFYKII